MKAPEFTKGDDGIYRVEFESLGETIDLALADGGGNHTRNAERLDRRLNGMDGRDDNFFNGYNREKLGEAIANPPEELILEVERIKQQIETETMTPTSRRRRVCRRLEMGDELDPDAWVQRSPEGWSETRYQAERKHVVKIAVNLSVDCRQTPDQLLYRGAAAAALSDVLTGEGYSVEIVAFCSHRSPLKRTDTRHVTRIIVKRSDTPLDIAAVAFALSEIAFFRSIVITAAARCFTASYRSGLGFPESLPERERGEFDIVLDDNITTETAAVAVLSKYAEGVKKG